MNRRTILGVALTLAVTGAVAAYAQSGAKKGSGAKADKHLVYTDDSGVAINGYDAVAYHTAAQPTEGDARFTADWNGAQWRFASAENLALFQGDPEKYAPAYGGYCAYGVAAANDTFDTDPNAWKVVDGTLYLNLNPEIQGKWLQDVPGFIRTGDANWPGLVRSKGE